MKNTEILLDQLYRFEGIMGKYNCQNGGRKCKFQTNFHRLIRPEINTLQAKLRLLELAITSPPRSTPPPQRIIINIKEIKI